MAKKSVYVRGTKTTAIIDLAKRANGVTCAEITEATGWVSGSAKWRVSHIAASYGMHSKRIDRADGSVAYRMLTHAPKKTTAKKTARKAA